MKNYWLDKIKEKEDAKAKGEEYIKQLIEQLEKYTNTIEKDTWEYYWWGVDVGNGP